VITTNFEIQKCKIELKSADPNTNSINNPYYTSKTKTIPLKMILYCNRNSDSPQPDTVQWAFSTGQKVYSEYYGTHVVF